MRRKRPSSYLRIVPIHERLLVAIDSLSEDGFVKLYNELCETDFVIPEYIALEVMQRASFKVETLQINYPKNLTYRVFGSYRQPGPPDTSGNFKSNPYYCCTDVTFWKPVVKTYLLLCTARGTML
jgi:hypothetical protein